MAVDSLGRIYVAGRVSISSSVSGVTTYWHRFAVARFRANGSLDTSFGNGGVVRHFVEARSDDAAAMSAPRNLEIGEFALQPDGKLVLAGQPVGQTGVALVRLDEAGRLDTSFGSGGVARVPRSEPFQAGKLAIANDGSIYLAGHSGVHLGESRLHTVVLKLNAQGFVDAGFGSGGEARVDLAG
jgi:uncharacterized delta-60 repeat protein